MRTFFSEFWRQVTSPLQVFLAVSISSVLTISGAFGTYLRMSFFERGSYWVVVVVLAIVMVTAIRILVDTNFPRLQTWRRGAVVSIGLTATYTPILWWIANTLTGDKRDYVTPFWMMMLIVLGVSMAIIQLNFLLQGELQTPRAKLFDRISDPKVREIYWITVRDHYVDVYTDRSMETLLMRFSDAIREMDGIAGAQVHRSHWVARASIVSMHREKGRNYLELKDGDQVPVSRAYRAEVESWLA